MRARVIINPSSGRQIIQHRAERLVNSLLADGTFTNVDTVKTRKGGDAYQAARFFQDWQFDLILVVGGDGTVNEVISGLLDGHHQTPLAILPAGTVNDFAFAMNLPRTEGKLAKMLRKHKTVAVDVGRANDRYFLNVAAAGLLTDVAYKVPSDAKTVLGKLAYVLEGARDLSLQSIEPIRVRVETPEQTFDEDILLILVSNTSSVGGFRSFAPQASVSDGLLDVIIVHRQNIFEILPLLLQVVNGDHVSHPKISYFQTDHLSLTCVDKCPIAMDLDGERGDHLPVEISVLPRAINLIVP
ncbi:MAG: YegS/Rv2252/BmrU family lipid kinase [Eubacteriales bacterium]|nr:YegS/Rv2252/BmrU family lipid kinase [Eubacteriales bacterium]